MTDLLPAEAYALCVLNPAGRASRLYAPQELVCLIVAVVWELLSDGYLAFDPGRRLVGKREPNDVGDYRSFLYDAAVYSPRTVQALAKEFLAERSGKSKKSLVALLLDSLEEADCLSVRKKLIPSHTVYLPDESAIQDVVELLRSNFLFRPTPSGDAVLLAAALRESELLDDLFPQKDADHLRQHVIEAKERATLPFVKDLADDLLCLKLTAASYAKA